jgi:uncharacterized membrane protein YeiB
MLIGLWLGRQNFNDHRRIKEIAIFSGAGFLVLQALSLLLTGVSTQLGLAAEESGFLFGTAPMPPFPLYLLSGACIAVTIIAGCVLIGKRFPTNAVLQWLGQTGKLALTFYVAHVVIGMGLVEVFGAQSLGDYSLFFSLTYAFFFSLACVIFANWWLKSHKTGPLEWVMRYVT